MNKTLLVPLMASLLLSACGEFSYKRGASAADLEQSRDMCKSSGSDAAVKKCLEDQGWFVHDLSDMDPVAVLMPSEDNRGSGSGSQADVAAAAASTMVEAGAPGASGSATPGSPATEAAKSAPIKNMMDKFKVTSWWKRGAGRTALEEATDQCVAELGEEHKPDPVTQYTTRGFLICMRKSGWYGLASK